MKYSRALTFLLLITVAVAVFLSLASVTEAQCSMCRAVLSASNNARFIRNFNLGVLVLLVPPVTMFCSIFVVLKRHGGSLESWSRGSGVNTSDHEDSQTLDS